MPKAFSRHAFEYIQKPVRKTQIIQVMTDALNIMPEKLQYIEFISNRQTIRLLYSDFIAVVSADHYLNVTDSNNNIYKIRQTFSEFVKPLENDSRFLQINKGIMVNMEYIVSIENNICTMKNEQTLLVKVRDSMKIKENWYQYGFNQIHANQKRSRK